MHQYFQLDLDVLHNHVKMVVFVLIFRRLTLIFVSVLIHMRVFIVISFTSGYALTLNVVVEQENFLHGAKIIQMIWLLITFAFVMSRAAAGMMMLGVTPQITVILRNYLFQNVKGTLLLVHYHLLLKDIIFVHGIRNQRLLDHAPYIMCGMTLKKNVLFKIIHCKRCFVLI
jgi:hypothetical protein